MSKGNQRKLVHIARNACGGIRYLMNHYCQGCRLEDDRSVPHEVRTYVDAIESAVMDYVSGKKPKSIKSTSDSDRDSS
jgi:hypothetical protein